MKKFRRWNRGLMLAVILIIGVIIFQAADQARFQRSIPLISGNIQDYLNNTSAVLTNETGKDTSSSAFLQNLDQFWSSDSRTKGYYYYTKSDFYNYLTQSEDSNLTLPVSRRLLTNRPHILINMDPLYLHSMWAMPMTPTQRAAM